MNVLIPLLTAFLVAQCPSPASSGREGLAVGPWRAWLDSPGGELPFDLEIQAEGSELHAWISNGDERLPIPRVSREGAEIVFGIDHFDAEIRTTLARSDGTRLRGSWRRRLGPDRWAELPFHATAGRAPRFLPLAPESGKTAPLARRWTAEFELRNYSSVVLFDGRSDGRVLGTFLHLIGDNRYLEGSFEAGRLRLSRFDGAQAFLYDARMQPDGTLAGQFWEAGYFEESWTARPDPDAALQDPFAHLRVGPLDLESLVFADLEGKPCTLSEHVRPGEVLIVEILGTWCPNCHDASELLMQLRREYGARGLRVVAIAFEMTGDSDRSVKFLTRYSERHGLDYPLFLASTDAVASPSDFFRPIEGDFAFPTILFVTGDGTVRATYVGFSGPATGEEHEHMKARWRARVEELLEERAAASS